MSIKNYTTEQLQGDLAAMVRMFPEGIPEAQYDRVNAIKNELKRRGADVVAKAMPGQDKLSKVSLESMTEDELTKELRALSVRIGQDQSNEELQNRFADVRYELRKRTNGTPAKEPERIVPRQVETRAIELPEVIEEPKLPEVSKGSFEPGMVERRTAEIPRREVPTSVAGWAAQPGGNGVLLSHTAKTEANSIVQLNGAMSIADGEKFLAMFQAALGKAKALS